MAKPPNIFTQFHDALIKHTVSVLRFAENVREKVTVNLYRLASDLVNKIRDASPSTKAGAAFVTKKLENLIRQAKKAITNAYADNADLLNASLRDLAKLENEYYPRMINGIIGADVAQVPMSITETKALADDSVILGGPASEWWDKQDRKLQDQFATQMRLGYTAGEGVEELVGRVRGEATGRVRKLTAPDGEPVEIEEYSGGIMEASRRDATALVRTSVQNLSNNVLNSTYDANDDVIKGKQWISTLDPFTCRQCQALDKCSWDMDGNPLDERSQQFPFQTPPAHINCRCVIIGLTFSWDELIKQNGGDVPDGLTEVDTATRASMNGQVDAGMNYDDWLQTQSESTQREVLGDGRWALWKGGKVTLGDLVDQSGRALTLEELSQLK